MRFTAALSSLLVVLPIVLPVLEVAAVPAQLNPHGSQGGAVQNAHFQPPPPKKAAPPPHKAAPPPPPPKKAAPPPPNQQKAQPPSKSGNGSAAASSSAAAAAASSSAAAASSSAAAAAASSSAAAAAASSSAAAAAASSSAAAATATSAASANSTDSDPQTSLTLDPSQVQPGLEQDGQAVAEAGQVPSLTSSNNFINFCLLLPNVPLTNGQQVVTGSCNPTIMGQIIPKASMPSAKFVNPTNFQTFAPNTTIAFKLAVNNMETGNFVNANTNYFAAPQQLNSANLLVAHSHVTCNAISSFQDTTPLDPQVFAFFKGLNAPAVDGILEADAANGLPPGFYRVCSINTAANHQPALVAVAQHASLDDCVYFQVAADAADVAASSSAAVAAATTAAAAATTDAAAAAATTAAAAAATTAAGNKVLSAQGSNGGAVNSKTSNNRRPTFTPPNRNQRPGQQQFGRPGGRNRFQPNFRGGRGRF